MVFSYFAQSFTSWNIDFSVISYALAGSTLVAFLVKLIADYVWRNHFTSLTVPSTDSRFKSIILWLSIHGPLKDCQHISIAVRDPNNQVGVRSFADDKQESEANNMRYSLLPRTCSFYFTHHKSGKWMHLNFVRAKDSGSGFSPQSYSSYDHDIITISTSGRSREALEHLIKDAENEYKVKSFGKTLVYHYTREYSYGSPGNWLLLNNPALQRPWNSVATKNNLKEELLTDIQDFQNSEEHYVARGIPYRRGYLLHGPPGTGKSSLIYSLASELDYSVCVVNLSRDINDFDLFKQMATAPKKSILLFEDVDVAVPSDKRKKEIKQRSNEGVEYSSTYSGSITLSGLLNALDGISSSDSHIVFMTTNIITNLDPALIRPGRVDVTYFLGNCNASQAVTMFQNAYRNEKIDEKRVKSLFNEVKVPVSPAKLQNHLLCNKNQPQKALENILQLREDQQVYEEDRTMIYRCLGYDANWMPFGNGKHIRPWDSIITQDNIKEEMLRDLEEFLKSKDMYDSRGITHRKGYLLYGPPGTGKSTLIAGIADKLHLNLCIVEFSSDDMSDSRLITQLSKIPGRSIVVMEEIDMALPSKDRRKQMEKKKEELNQYGPVTKVTLSGVLNALDGLFTSESQIVIMTTNYIDNLDPALIRPGRVDQKFFLGNCNSEQVKEMLKASYDTASAEDIEKITEQVDSFEDPVSPALLECFILRHNRSAEDALNHMEELKAMAKENAVKEVIGNDKGTSTEDLTSEKVDKEEPSLNEEEALEKMVSESEIEEPKAMEKENVAKEAIDGSTDDSTSDNTSKEEPSLDEEEALEKMVSESEMEDPNPAESQ